MAPKSLPLRWDGSHKTHKAVSWKSSWRSKRTPWPEYPSFLWFIAVFMVASTSRCSLCSLIFCSPPVCSSSLCLSRCLHLRLWSSPFFLRKQRIEPFRPGSVSLSALNFPLLCDNIFFVEPGSDENSVDHFFCWACRRATVDRALRRYDFDNFWVDIWHRRPTLRSCRIVNRIVSTRMVEMILSS